MLGKFRLKLIKLTSFKTKLLIRSIMNNPCSNKRNINIMHSEIVNKTGYDDSGKPMTQNSQICEMQK